MKIISIILMLISANGFAQKDTSLSLLGEVSRYINQEKSKSKKRHNDCKIYVLDVFKEDYLQKGYSISIGYILNSSEYKYVRSKYYFNIDEDIILVHFDKYTSKDNIESIDLLKVNVLDEYKLAQKLFPVEVIIVSYQGSGLIASFNEMGGLEKSTYYENVNSMPFERTVYSKFELKGKIDLIEK